MAINELNELKINVNVTPEVNIKTTITQSAEIIAKVTSGARGKSAHEIWLDDGHTGSESDFLNWLKSDSYIFNQGTPSDTWVIKHDLGKYPSVTIVDSADRVLIGEVFYGKFSRVIDRITKEVTFIKDESADPTKWVTISFAAGFSGKAYLN